MPGEKTDAKTETTVVYLITQKNCARCPAAKMVLEEALMGTDIPTRIVDLEKMDPDFEFKLLEEQVFIASTPTVIIARDGSMRVLYSGEVPTVEGIRDAVRVN